MQDAKNRQKVAICAPLYNFVGLSSNTSSTCPHNMVNFGPLADAVEIDPVLWGTPANFNGFRV